MANALKCPNPSCPYLFDPTGVPAGVVLTCPRCGMRFTLGGWLNRDQNLGVEGSAFLLENRAQRDALTGGPNDGLTDDGEDTEETDAEGTDDASDVVAAPRSPAPARSPQWLSRSQFRTIPPVRVHGAVVRAARRSLPHAMRD